MIIKHLMLIALIFSPVACSSKTDNGHHRLKAENDSLKTEIRNMKAAYHLSESKIISQNNDMESIKETSRIHRQTNTTDKKYIIPSSTRIGHIHLKVSDLERSLAFYCDLLGFELTTMYGTDAAFVSAGGYHHHIGLNTWTSKNAPHASDNSVGLYHTAILYPTRRDLAVAVDRLIKAGYPLTGASDHGVSEAIYLDDPDGNGVELYWDKPRDQWPRKEDGSLDMYTRRLDFENLMKELAKK